MPYVIRNLGLAGIELPLNDPQPRPLNGDYLQTYDPDAMGGYGLAIWTDEPNGAYLFDTPDEALRFWRRQSTVQPLRSDGKPNRPLTAYTVEIIKVD